MLETLPDPTQDPSLQAGSRLNGPEVAVGQAIEFFNQNFRLNLDGEGHMFDEPTKEQLADLREWHEVTTKNGLDMPDIDSFTAKTVLARALMPQTNAAGEVQYLFGRGVGVELALQGQVEGRQKQLKEVPYRTHSDFEIYGASADNYDAIPHGDRFKAVFGGQEIYPATKTKGLKELPDDYLLNNAEVVNYGGLDFLVPPMEAQFVDKFESGNPKTEKQLRGKSDAELLAQAYPLEAHEVHRLVDDHVIQPQLEALDEPEIVAKETANALDRKLKQASRRLNTIDRDQLLQDPALLNYAENRGIRGLSTLVDHAGELSPDAVFELKSLETSRQLEVYRRLASHHQAIDAILQPA